MLHCYNNCIKLHLLIDRKTEVTQPPKQDTNLAHHDVIRLLETTTVEFLPITNEQHDCSQLHRIWLTTPSISTSQEQTVVETSDQQLLHKLDCHPLYLLLNSITLLPAHTQPEPPFCTTLKPCLTTQGEPEVPVAQRKTFPSL
ncbi:hypothetical protein VNO80_25330 [Phaseolus coccineus]|uniref:Uncharacterized protein n=1 Tax=Phaseolus coccineus TaxID=3886 RepID=A0AAN9QLU8_PHACN